MARTSLLVSTSLLTLSLAAGCGPKEVEEAPPPVGWADEGTEDAPWTGQCYYPPAYEEMVITDRRMARQEALQSMKSQWLGERDDSVSFDADVVEELEIVLLGRPELIESVSRENLTYCKQVMGAGESTGAWSSWLSGLPDKLTEGECDTPLDYQLIQYLDIQKGWQQPIPFCEGNRARIEATQNDQYRITEDGPWMNANGDTSAAATDPNLPCNFEGCYPGMLIGRFVTEDGVENVFPIGTETTFTAPAHGTLTYTINDTTYYDNKWHSEGTIVDHTAITVTPID